MVCESLHSSYVRLVACAYRGIPSVNNAIKAKGWKSCRPTIDKKIAALNSQSEQCVRRDNQLFAMKREAVAIRLERLCFLGSHTVTRRSSQLVFTYASSNYGSSHG